jgi:PAS domain S-box-containing protein
METDRSHPQWEMWEMFAYEWDATNDVMVRAAESLQILGANESTHTSGRQIFANCHPDDRERLTAAAAKLSPEKPWLQLSYRSIRPNGAVVWVEANGRAYFDERGQLSRIIGMVADVTARKQVEEALRKSEERLHLAVRAGRMYAFEWDAQTDVIVRSGECADILNWMADPMHDSGRHFAASVHPDDREAYAASETVLTPGNPNYQASYRVLRPDGGVVWLEARGHALFNHEGKMLHMVGMVTDVTERKKGEETLRQREKELTEAQRVAQVGSWQWNPKTDEVVWSRELYRIAGCDPNLPPPAFQQQAQLYTLESWERLKCTVAKALETGAPYTLDLEMIRPDGSTRWITDRGEVWRDGVGQIAGLRGTAQDVTERKQAEERLSQATDRLSLAMEASTSVGWDSEVKSGRDVWFGDLQTIFGIASNTYAGSVEEFLNYVHPDDRPQVSEALAYARQNRKLYAAEFRVVRPDGTVRWLVARGKFYYSTNGDPERMLGVSLDITDRKQAEDAVRETEKRYRRIVETTNEGVWLLDSKLHTAYVNRQMAEMLGYEPGEMVGRSVFDSYFPEDVEYKQQLLERRQQGVREQFEERLRQKDGSELWVRMAAIPFFKENGEFDGALAMVSDITERKRAEEALRGSEARLRLAAQVGKMYAYEWDVATDKIVRSEECTSVLGSSDQPKQLTRQQLLASVHPDDRAVFVGSVDQLTPDNPTTRISYRVLRPDGSLVWLEKNARAFFDEKGRMLRMIGMVADITERKEAEEALTSARHRMIEAQEQERARIARELHDHTNQRLALLAIGIEELKNDIPNQTAELRARVDELHEQVLEISADVQALSHELHSSKLDHVGLVAAMRGFCKEFSEQQKLKVGFESQDLPSPVPPDVSLCLFRVLQEASHNAAKHSGAKQFEVELWGTPDEIHLTVSDFGSGFELEAARLGPGLGLTSMQERMQLMQGTLSIESRPKLGTTIHARVPLKQQSHSKSAGT